MIETLLADPVKTVLGGATGIVGIVYFVRFISRMYHAEKKDTSIDLASQSLFENLRLENQRMATQMNLMSIHIQALAVENAELNKKVSQLTISIGQLVTLETENKYLQEQILVKDHAIEELSKTLEEALKAVHLRKTN